MRYFLLFVMLTAIVVACKKDTGIANATLLGKWNILTDSTYSGVGVGNHAVNYTGQDGDYFNFTAEGKLYTKEGDILDTLNYHFTSNTTMIIDAFGLTLNGVPATCTITNFATHTVTITAPVALTPGGAFGRKVNLIR